VTTVNDSPTTSRLVLDETGQETIHHEEHSEQSGEK
jgi:hypothetical protein